MSEDWPHFQDSKMVKSDKLTIQSALTNSVYSVPLC